MKTRFIYIAKYFVVVSLCLLYKVTAQQFSDYPKNLGQTVQYYAWAADTIHGGSKQVTYYTGTNITNIQRDCDDASAASVLGQTAIGTPTDPRYPFDFSARTAYQWDFSGIKTANPTISSVKLEIWYIANAGNMTVDVKQLPTFQYNMAMKDRWAAIKTATKYTSFINEQKLSFPAKYVSMDIPSTNQICQDIVLAIKAGALFSIGLMIEGDDYWPDVSHFGTGYMQTTQSTFGCQGVKLTVNYTIPISVTVQNGPPVSGDSVIVDGTKYSSPHSFSWTSSGSHSLLARTEVIGSTTYTPAGWTDLTTNTTYGDNPHPAAPIQNTTYQANFSVSIVTATVNQKLSTNQTVDSIGHWEGGTDFTKYKAPKSLPLSTIYTEYLRAKQDTLSGQKYNNWDANNAIEPDVSNHHGFAVHSYTTTLTSHFLPTTQGSTIGINLLEMPGSYSGLIQFKDPWLIDSTDASHNNTKLNRGMNALYKNRTAPFSPNIGTSYSGDVYKGVFLNQIPDPSNSQKPYYSVGANATQPFTVGGQAYTGAFINWTQTNAAFQDSTSSQTGIVFKSSSATATANYKGIHLSNTASSFSNNSQRKLVRTKDGWLHQVYESMGRVWLEESTDNGSTWFLGNGGQPLDNGAGKCPSIDWHYNVADPTNPNLNAVVVTFQQRSGSTYTIPYAIFKYTNGSYVYQGQNFSGPLYTEPAGGDPYISTNANPNIAWGEYYYFALTFERKSTSGTMQPGIYWMYGFMYESGVQPTPSLPNLPKCTNPILISGTTSSSINATLSLNKLSTSCSDFDVEYQQGSNSIKDVQLSCMQNGVSWNPVQYLPLIVISSATGVLNYKPSMVQMPDCNIRVCWIRSLNGDSVHSPFSVNVVYWNSATPSQYSIYGWLPQSVSINVSDDNAKTFYAFGQYSNCTTWENYIGNGTSYVKLNTAGRDVQLSNGPSSGGSTSMYISSFYPFTTPYYFKNAGAIGTQLQKSSSDQITYGRGATLVKGDLQFYYSLKSLTVDNTNIKFTGILEKKADSSKAFRRLTEKDLYYPNLDSLNTVLLSEPFTLNSNSSISFSEQAGFIDTSAAIKELGANGYVAYKLELVDNNTNKTIAAIKGVKFTATSLSSCKLFASQLNVSKVGTKTVRVKIAFSTNVDSLQGALMSEYGTIDNNTIAKLAVNEIVLQSPEIITEYALEQNYPNPFNPTTTIHYQLPNAGHVTLKVYDMLGREVATLVDGVKEIGSYSATFDGARLASGVYIMRLVASSQEGKSFVQTKKMVLMK
jgi:hypothetical protein